MPQHHRRDFLATGAAAAIAWPLVSRAADDLPPLKILLFSGDLPEVRKELETRYKLEVFTAGQIKGKSGEDNVEGLERLAEADVWIGSMHKRTFPSEKQLEHVRTFLAAGKPFVGYRAASHAFQNWLAADKAIWGAKYGGHHLLDKDPVLVIEPAEGARSIPSSRGWRFRGRGAARTSTPSWSPTCRCCSARACRAI